MACRRIDGKNAKPESAVGECRSCVVRSAGSIKTLVTEMDVDEKSLVAPLSTENS